jgi:hypothetical protein
MYIMRDGVYNNKQMIPPYALNTSLYKNPSFKTTNMNDYTTQLGKNKYEKIKSKYKNIPKSNNSIYQDKKKPFDTFFISTV